MCSALYLVKSCQSLERHIFWQINITINNLIIQFIHAPIKGKLQTIGVSIGTLGLQHFYRHVNYQTDNTCQLDFIFEYYCVLLCTCEIQAFKCYYFFSTNMGHYKRTFYSYGWKWAWRWPCFGTNLSALLCKSSYSYSNLYFSVTISITKQRRFVSKKGHRQPHIHWKARVQSLQL